MSSPPTGTVPLGRSGSLRSKLSLPTLRIRNTERVHPDERSPTSSLTPTEDSRTVQVKDTDFELVKPTISIPGDDSPVPPSPLYAESSSILGRSNSPAFSVISSITSRSRAHPPPNPSGPSVITAPTAPTDAAEIEAHRQRELRWMSAISTIPSSQARKSKKIRKLLQEGVPSSVRYLVWAHLTDSRAKRLDGIYEKLGKRERVAASASIERDVEHYLTRHPQVQASSLNNILQAYLTMVPDVQYNRALVSIAGNLLQLSPEEDAFWTLISLMNTHLRSYFAINTVQLDVDATLFGKAVEANDAAVAKKVFVDMTIHPINLCRSWFTTLFVDVLPVEYLYRVWDLFLFEGVTFLFRIGISIFSCLKRVIMDTSDRDFILTALLHPPLPCLPPNADALLEQAFAVKLKDDDVRKQRNKMTEAQMKRQTQARPSPLSSQSSIPNISLPKT
ncbi:RabGAP/TBC [Panus rudis PR-1116 ss-1]|nr:RabGAP/TBC [Panus rudis PR-1116 ss-1]